MNILCRLYVDSHVLIYLRRLLACKVSSHQRSMDRLENLILEYLDKLMKQLVGQAYQLSTNAGPE